MLRVGVHGGQLSLTFHFGGMMYSRDSLGHFIGS
jgi:hypothetical protein